MYIMESIEFFFCFIYNIYKIYKEKEPDPENQ